MVPGARSRSRPVSDLRPTATAPRQRSITKAPALWFGLPGFVIIIIEEPLDHKDRFIGPVDVSNDIIQRHAHELYDLLRTLPGHSGDGRDDRSPAHGQAHDKHGRWNKVRQVVPSEGASLTIIKQDLAVIIRKRLDSALVKALLRAQGKKLQGYPVNHDGLRVVSIGAIDVKIRLGSPSILPLTAA
ncbi:hypothetical protein G3M48_006638 [Beauveria asiatica]|uniref:Uncharacterized protein n=1 Tax=Beauveria asiatica TaxID=1069075 RepID=A0AAW0RP79_9HYPO